MCRYDGLSFFWIWRPSAILDLLCGWLDHPRRAFDGHYHCAIFGWNRCSCFDNMQFQYFCEFGLKTRIHATCWCFFGAHPPKCHSSSYPLKDRLWAEPRHVSRKAWISAARFERGVGTRNKCSSVAEMGEYRATVWPQKDMDRKLGAVPLWGSRSWVPI